MLLALERKLPACQLLGWQALGAPDHAAWAPPQAQRANALAAEQGLAERVSFQVADALQQPFADGSFDLVWSLESGEHMCGPAARIISRQLVCSSAHCCAYQCMVLVRTATPSTKPVCFT